MNIVKNPAWSRPLSTNVRKLMKQAREFPDNPDVIKGRRRMTDRDYSYCAMQGEIFMAAVDLGYSMEDFAPMYMCSQLAGVMDHSFSRAGKMDEDGVAGMLKLPLLLKSPETIMAVALWLNHIVEGRALNESPTEAVALSASKTSMALAEDTDAYECPLRLYKIEEKLGGADFVRISKAMVVNFRAIWSIHPDFGGRLTVTLENGERQCVSRQYAPAIKQKLMPTRRS